MRTAELGDRGVPCFHQSNLVDSSGCYGVGFSPTLSNHLEKEISSTSCRNPFSWGVTPSIYDLRASRIYGLTVLASMFDEMNAEHAQSSVMSMVSTEDLYWVERLCCEAEENEDDASRRLEAAYLSHLREGLRSEQKQMESAMRHRNRACLQSS